MGMQPTHQRFFIFRHGNDHPRFMGGTNNTQRNQKESKPTTGKSFAGAAEYHERRE
jgi:hypothetical protein